MRRNATADQLVVPLDGSGHPTAEVGGKGAALDVLVDRGFRVPAAAAVTTAAYRKFVAEAGLESFLGELGERELPTDVETEATEIDAKFLDAAIPEDLTAAIRDAAAGLTEDGRLLAVRSSATAEDLAGASFAGQHLSVLCVKPDEVEPAVRRVWASLWHPAARAYRRHMGVDNDELAMAVVLMRMIPAERSGVCFTVDPSRPGTARIEVVEGLGEALVSGQKTPDYYRITRDGLRPLGDRFPDELREVVRTALRIEEELGRPQDVEWSIVGGELWVLQARPVTTVETEAEGDGFDTPPDPGGVYAPAGVSEMLPGVLPPLLWTINGPMLEDAFRRLFAQLRVLPDDLSAPFALVGRFDGQAALNLTRIKDAARQMAGGTGAEIERQYLGQVVSEEEEDEKRPGLIRRMRSFGAGARAFRLRKQAELDGEVFEAAVGEVTAIEPDLREMLDRELLAYRARLRDLAANGVAAEVAVAVAAVASYRALEVALTRWTGDQAPNWAQRITRDAAVGDGAGCASPANVWKVFRQGLRDPQLAGAIDGATPADIERRLCGLGPVGNAFVVRLWREADGLGSTAVYGGPTWAEQHEYVWTVLLGCLAAGRAADRPDATVTAKADLAELEATLTKTWRWRLGRVITGQVVDMRRRMLRQLTANARSLLRRRETVKAAVLALGGEERRVTLELARRFTRRGALRRHSDVDLLADWELDDLVLGAPAVAPIELERRAQAVEQFRAGPTLPPLVHYEGELAGPDVDDAVLRGWGASPGRHRGPVRVVRDLAAAASLQPGEVLVAPATDPSWTPLFLIAGAVVVERGGPLSHAAIVAREFGLPAVLNARDATARLETGVDVDVDGAAGTVVPIQQPGDEPGADEEAAA